MMNKKGELVLRDVMFMMIIVSTIFVLAGLFVSEMAVNYENTDMSSEWGLEKTNSIANSTFYSTSGEVNSVGSGLQTNATGILAFIQGAGNVLSGIGPAFMMVLTAPNTIGDLLSATLEDAGVPSGISFIIGNLIKIVFWLIIIFTIVAAFLRGGKL